MSYPDISMFVGEWSKGERVETLPVYNPAVGEIIREAPKALKGLNSRTETIAVNLTQEHGKPVSEARAERSASVDMIDWFGEECRRSYGYVIPPRKYQT